MNDIEFTDLKELLKSAMHILSSNEYDEESTQLQDIIDKVKKSEYV